MTTLSKGTFRADIEGLRAIAVLLVIAFHSGASAFRGGFIGVDVFFVLSGYLFTGLLIEELSRSQRIDLIQFYSRRVRRLLPASALVVGVTALVSSRLLPPLDQASLGQTALSTFLYASNLYFAHARNDYFASDSATNPLLHTWSLAVEEQFYMLWPVLLFVAWRVWRSRGSLAWLIGFTTLVSFAGCLWLTKTNQAYAFFLSPARAWEFGAGGLFSMVPVGIRVPKTLGSIFGWVGLITVLLCGVFLSSSLPFPGAVALLPVLGTGAALMAGRWHPEAGIARMLKRQPLQYLGKISYSLYLWHWPVLVLAAATVPHFSVTVRIICVLGSVGLAAATYVVVENPIRFNRLLISRPLANVAAALIVGILGAALSRGWHYQVTKSPSYIPYASAMDDIPRLYKQPCRADFTEATPRECTFGDKDSQTTIALFGDSHAAQWFPALETMAKQHKWKLVTFVKSSCPSVSVASYNTFLQRQETECDQWRETALHRIVSLHPAMVVLGTLSMYYQPEHPDRQLTFEEWQSGSRKTFGQFAAAGIRTTLIRDTPYPGFNVPKCLSTVAWTKRGSCIAPARSVALNANVFEAEQSAARPFKNVNVVDLSNAICGPETCELVRGGVIVYRDQNHLTGTYIRELTPLLEAQIVPLMPPIVAAELRPPRLGAGRNWQVN